MRFLLLVVYKSIRKYCIQTNRLVGVIDILSRAYSKALLSLFCVFREARCAHDNQILRN